MVIRGYSFDSTHEGSSDSSAGGPWTGVYFEGTRTDKSFDSMAVDGEWDCNNFDENAAKIDLEDTVD